MIIFGVNFSKVDILLFSMAGALFMALVFIIGYRQSDTFSKRKKEKEKTINNILSPFKDAILNIESGDHNFISIANSLFENQKAAITHAKTIASTRKRQKIEKVWQEYETFYSQKAKGQVLSMFAVLQGFEEEEKTFRCHINTIIEVVKKI